MKLRSASSEHFFLATLHTVCCKRAPQYLADHLIPASDAAPRRLRLRSDNLNRLTVPRCRLTTYS